MVNGKSYGILRYHYLLKPVFSRAVVQFFLSYGLAASLLVVALYLFLPILRSAGAATQPEISYEIALGAFTASFTLAWWVPFALVAVSAWALTVTKRMEFRIWRASDSEFWRQYLATMGDEAPDSDVERCAKRTSRARAMAVRRLALFWLEVSKVMALFLILLLAEPAAALLAAIFAIGLSITFRRAIWHRSRSEQRDAESAFVQRIGHRMRLASAKQVYFVLMPLVVMALLFIARLSPGISFDLAELVFIAALTSVGGSAIANMIQNLLYLKQGDPVVLEPWSQIRLGDRAAALAALNSASRLTPVNEGDADDDGA